MLLLAFDTATPAVTVALLDGDGTTARVLAERFSVDARRHGELLAPGIAGVLAEAGVDRRDLHAVAVGVGPGPFTGLRVGVVTARTLGAVLGVPVHGVCTLDAIALAAAATLRGPYLVATDARRREVYWAAYQVGSDGPDRADGPHVTSPADVPCGLPVVGHGGAVYPDAFPDVRAPVYPRAADVGRWVMGGRPLLDPVPLYLRRPDAAEPGGRKPVLR